MRGECGVERCLAARRHLGDAAVEHVGRGEERQAVVVVVIVVPAKEGLAVGAAVEQRFEVVREVGLVLECLKPASLKALSLETRGLLKLRVTPSWARS